MLGCPLTLVISAIPCRHYNQSFCITSHPYFTRSSTPRKMRLSIPIGGPRCKTALRSQSTSCPYLKDSFHTIWKHKLKVAQTSTRVNFLKERRDNCYVNGSSFISAEMMHPLINVNEYCNFALDNLQLSTYIQEAYFIETVKIKAFDYFRPHSGLFARLFMQANATAFYPKTDN